VGTPILVGPGLMQLRSRYALPYAVIYDDGPLMSVGQDIRIRAALNAVPTAETVDAMDSLVLPFFLLGTSGALAGTKIAPWTSTMADKEGPFVNEGIVEWILRSCTVDERSITVLSQMLLSAYDSAPIARITFSGARPFPDVLRLEDNSLTPDPCPARYGEPGFPVIGEAELTAEVVVRVIFEVPPSPEIQKAADAELFSWAAGVVSGAYGVAPVRPDRCTASIDETEYAGSELTWHMSRVRAHPAALDGLVNVFASISRRTARVSQIIIE
jgi:hypothetical protein